MTHPLTIKILSDQNELQFVDLRNGVYTYIYSKSKTKKGSTLKLSEVELQKLIKNNQ